MNIIALLFAIYATSWSLWEPPTQIQIKEINILIFMLGDTVALDMFESELQYTQHYWSFIARLLQSICISTKSAKGASVLLLGPNTSMKHVLIRHVLESKSSNSSSYRVFRFHGKIFSNPTVLLSNLSHLLGLKFTV